MAYAAGKLHYCHVKGMDDADKDCVVSDRIPNQAGFQLQPVKREGRNLWKIGVGLIGVMAVVLLILCVFLGFLVYETSKQSNESKVNETEISERVMLYLTRKLEESVHSSIKDLKDGVQNSLNFSFETVEDALMRKAEYSKKYILSLLKDELNESFELVTKKYYDTVLTTVKTVQCDDGWKRHKRKCYFFSDDKTDWHQAKAKCEGQYNAKLAEPETQLEIVYLRNQVQNVTNGRSLFWLGGSDEANEGQWIWASDKRPITKFDWAYIFGSVQEPNNLNGNEHCLEIHYTLKYRWNDKICTAENRYICEKSE